MSIPEPLLKLDSYYFLLFVIPGFITVWTYQKIFKKQIKSDFEYLGFSLFCGLLLFLVLIFTRNLSFLSFVFGEYFPFSLIPAAVMQSFLGALCVLAAFFVIKIKDEINSRIKRYLKSDDAKLTDKPKEIEDIIQAIVNNISVDEKRLFSSDDKKEYLRKQKANKEDKYQCFNCKKYFYKEELTMDHIDPWSKGGRTVLSNAQLLCGPCNIKKGNRS